MAPAREKRLAFGPAKYAAFNLLLCRFFRHHCKAGSYSYITLGGTELKDLENLHFIDEKLVSSARSFETDRERYRLAAERIEELSRFGVQASALNDNIFSCSRNSEGPHLLFFDFTGIFAWADYAEQFAGMFERETIREGDAFFLTSHLGHNPGWARVLDTFSGEFNLLGATDQEDRRKWYRRAHPSFTLFRALTHAGLDDELHLECLGCVEYKDSSPMGVYGYVVTAGKTEFIDLVRKTLYFHIARGYG